MARLDTSHARSRYPALQWLYAILNMLGILLIFLGIAYGMTRHAAETSLSKVIQLWSLAGGISMGIVCFSLAAIMRVLFDLAVQSGLAEPLSED